jgi:hypothetical protein
MHQTLRPEQVDILVGTSGVNHEFSQKIRELDRRLKLNGMQYTNWDSLNDRQQDIFTRNLFRSGGDAASVDEYVRGAVESCWCPDTVEELHHHSPVLMKEIEKQQEMLPDVTVKIGEGLNNLNETIDNILELLLVEALGTKTPEEQAFKKFLNSLFAQNDIPVKTKRKEHAYHHRAYSPIPGSSDIKKLKPWFSKFDIDIREEIPGISDAYDTFILRAKKDIPAKFQQEEYSVRGAKDVAAGTEIIYVPTDVRAGNDRFILKKETNPAGLGLANDKKKWTSASEIVDATAAALNGNIPSPYPKGKNKPEWVAPELIALLGPAQSTGSPISFDTPLSFGAGDLTQISQDYGEILAAIWGMSQPSNQKFSLPYAEVIFPTDPAAKLLDFFAITDTGAKIPVSVKSGTTGGKVTIKNITETAKVLYEMSKGKEGGIVQEQQFIAVDQAMDLAPTKSVQPLYIHKVLRQDPANPNSPLGTRTIQVLAQIMSKHGAPGTKWKDLDAKQVSDWLETKTNEELIGNRMPTLQNVKNKKGETVPGYVEPKVKKGTGILEPLWKEAKSKPLLDKYIKGKREKELLVYSPMGSQMVKLLNESPAIQAELNRLAQTLTVVQANVNAKTKTLSFQLSKFKEAEFVFDWPGYLSGNALGFRMKLNN